MSPSMSVIRLKRVYAPPEAADGARVLVDRLWPRGLSRAKASIDLRLNDHRIHCFLAMRALGTL